MKGMIVVHLIVFTTSSPVDRISGGNDAKRFQFPYQVSLLYEIEHQYHHGCGGTLINETRVVTAAHCIPLSLDKLLVVFGMLDQIDHQDVQIRRAKQFKPHPKYSGGANSGPNDIAIIVLSEPVKLTRAVQIAELGTKEDCDAIDMAILSGWGAINWVPPIYPRCLQYAELPRITLIECAKNIVKAEGDVELLDDTQLCTAASPGLSQSACRTDSGGPLVRLSNMRLIGIVAWGILPCGFRNAPTVYTRICSHLEFIQG